MDAADVVLREIDAECARIGFGVSELGGLAIAGEQGLMRFRDLLREVPSGESLESFVQRMRSYGIEIRTAAEELRELEAEENRTRTTTCSFCGRSKSDERKLVHGESGIAICSDCVRLAGKILAE